MKKIISDKGLIFVTKDPEFVVSLGGDGTFLFCERLYPGIPKLLIRDSKVCEKCVGSSEETVLDFIRLNEYNIEEEQKLELEINGKKLLITNDVMIRNEKIYQALRINVYVDGEKKFDEVIGDGVVIASSFGSTAYFRSITRETFDKGMGVAFNNPVKEMKPLIIKEGIVKIEIVRGDAQLAADNDSNIYSLKEGGTITVKLSDQRANLIKIAGFNDGNF